MPQPSKVVIVYSPNQALVRTVIIPDQDSQIHPHTTNLTPGERVLVTSYGLYLLLGPDKVLEKHLGRKADSGHCALVDSRGIVVGFLNADCAIDRTHYSDGHTLHADPLGTRQVGDGWYQRGN